MTEGSENGDTLGIEQQMDESSFGILNLINGKNKDYGVLEMEEA